MKAQRIEYLKAITLDKAPATYENGTALNKSRDIVKTYTYGIPFGKGNSQEVLDDVKQRILNGAKVGFYYCSSSIYIPSSVKKSNSNPEIMVISPSRITNVLYRSSVDYYFERSYGSEQVTLNRDKINWNDLTTIQNDEGEYPCEYLGTDKWVLRTCKRYNIVPEKAKNCEIITDFEFEKIFSNELPNFTLEDLDNFIAALGDDICNRDMFDPTTMTLFKTLGGYNWHDDKSYAYLMWAVRFVGSFAPSAIWSITDSLKPVNDSAYKIVRELRNDGSIGYMEVNLVHYIDNISEKKIDINADEDFMNKYIYPYMKTIISAHYNSFFRPVKDWENKIFK